MSYEDKYLKYKNKYITLKNNLIGGEGEYKVLIIVDVQECFLNGTMGNANKTLVEEYKKKIFNFVNNEKNKYDVIVFTKDNHPQHHMSSGLYFPHCVEQTAKYCFKEEKEEERKEMIEKLYKTSFMSTLPHRKDDSYTKILTEDMTNKHKALGEYNGTSFEDTYRYNTKIQLEQQFLECTSTKKNLNELDLSKLCLNPLSPLTKDSSKIVLKPVLKAVHPIKITNEKIGDVNKPFIIRMNKGELCNFDAYGAFAYHVSYKKNSDNILEEIDIVHNPPTTEPDWKKLSTGLAEFLISMPNRNNKKFNIDVCGLVTNICVVSTCVTGCKVFKALGFNDYKFNILNENCLNLLTMCHKQRNAKKIIIDNKLTDNITISDKLDLQNFNPLTEYSLLNYDPPYFSLKC